MRRRGKLKVETSSNAAADVVARVARGRANVDETELLGIWSDRGEEELRALRQMGQVWNDMGALSSRYGALMGPPTWRERCVKQVDGICALLTPGWLAGITLATTAVLLLICRLLAPNEPHIGVAAKEIARDYNGGAAQVISLDDGSEVDLLADTQMHVELEANHRLIRLSQGHARFSVAHDHNRPLIIQAGDTQVRVVGTKFELSYRDGCTLLSVLEGVVQVASAGGEPRRLIAAEDTASSDGSGVNGGCLSTQMRHLARLSYRDAPLEVVIADANRFYGHKITIASPGLGSRHITASFTLAQIDEMLASLSSALPLTLTRSQDGDMKLEAEGR